VNEEINKVKTETTRSSQKTQFSYKIYEM